MKKIKRKVYTVTLFIFVVLGVVMGIYQLTQGVVHKGLLGLASVLFFLAPPLLRRLLRLRKDPYLLYIQVFAFCILAYDFGCVLELFDAIPHLDKVSHFLSGFVFTTMGACLYLLLSAGAPAPLHKRWLLVGSYGVFFSSFVAVVWEMCEFLGYVLTGHDSQHHLTSGVFDTMGDLIACLLGSLLCLGALVLYYKRNIRLVSAAILEEFDGCLPQGPAN